MFWSKLCKSNRNCAWNLAFISCNLSHLLYGVCVNIFIMNRYISKSYTTSKNTIDRQYTDRGQLWCQLLLVRRLSSIHKGQTPPYFVEVLNPLGLPGGYLAYVAAPSPLGATQQSFFTGRFALRSFFNIYHFWPACSRRSDSGLRREESGKTK